MCLILLSYKSHKNYPLILIANRDEFYERPTKFATWQNDILGGQDLRAGGMWLGVNKKGYIAAVTNYRDPLEKNNRKSRGTIVANFLEEDTEAIKYLENLNSYGNKYNGYNCVIGNLDQLCYYSNMQREIITISPGIYGICNHLLDTPWPKLTEGKRQLENLHSAEIFDVEKAFAILQNNQTFPDNKLPNTGVSLEWERLLSSVFIKSEVYGTRCSTVMFINKDREIHFYERSFNQEKMFHKCNYSFTI